MGPDSRHDHNLVLVGQRGSGKTTLGRILALRLGRPFVDLDEVLEERGGRSVDALLRELGERAFREREAEVLRWAASISGSVIATGGGAVLHGSAMAALAATGCVLYLDLPRERLLERARIRPRPALTPLPLEAELARLQRERAPLYRACADITMSVDEPEPILAAFLAWSAS